LEKGSGLILVAGIVFLKNHENPSMEAKELSMVGIEDLE
jgi:hypothetical protein